MALQAILSGAGMGLGAYGDMQKGAATVEGAQTEADIRALNRAYQEKLFDEEMERLRPYHETAVHYGIPAMQEYMTEGQVDLSEMPLYNMQNEIGMAGLDAEGVGGTYAQNRFGGALNAAEQDATYNRYQDLIQLGMGAADQAGAGAGNFANSQTASFLNTGNALAQGQMQAGNQRNSMYRNLVGQASSIPAWQQQNRYNKQYNERMSRPTPPAKNLTQYEMMY